MPEHRKRKGRGLSDSEIPTIVVVDEEDRHVSRKKSRKHVHHELSREGSPRSPHSRSRSFGPEREHRKSRHERDPEGQESPRGRKSVAVLDIREGRHHRHRDQEEQESPRRKSAPAIFTEDDRHRRDPGGEQSPRGRKSVVDVQGPVQGQDGRPQPGGQRKSIAVVNPSIGNSTADSRRKTRRKTEIIQLVPRPNDWRQFFYKKLVYIGLNCFCMIIGIVSLFVLPILYLIIPRDFAGQTQYLSVRIFLVLILCALGFSYILVSSFAFVMYSHKFYKIGYIFNGNPFEIFLYVIGLIYVMWILTTVRENSVKSNMQKAIMDNYLEPWHSVQSFFKCCGINGYADWGEEADYRKDQSQLLPMSCCKDLACKKNYSLIFPDELWEHGKFGCLDTVLLVSKALNWTSFFLFLIGITITFIGIISVREAYKHKDSPKHATLFFEPNWMLPFTRGPKAVRGDRRQQHNPSL